MSVLNRDRLIVFVHGACREPLTLEQCTLRAHQLSERVKAADAALLGERVRLGVLLLQVRRDLRRGEWGIWLAGGGVHQKTAERCMRYAARFADTRGELDRQKLFDCLHAADAEMFPSIEQFDEHRVSLVRVDRAIAVSEADDWSGPETPNRMGRSTNSSIISGVGGTSGLPRARVGDVAGQGMLDIFTPMLDEVRDICRLADTLDHSGRRELRDLNERHRCELRSFRDRHSTHSPPSSPSSARSASLREASSSAASLLGAGHNNGV